MKWIVEKVENLRLIDLVFGMILIGILVTALLLSIRDMLQ